MAKRKMTKIEALKLSRTLREAKIRFVKREDVEDGEVYAIVTPTSADPTVTFKNGDLLVGPFASEEEAQAAVGDDVALYTGDADSSMPEEEVLAVESKIKSNLMRMRRNVVEKLSAKVKADILRESEALDVDTDVKSGEETKEGEAGVADIGGGIASFINAADTGPNKTDVDTDSDAAAKDIEVNVLEARTGQLVKVFNKSGKKIDTGLLESVSKGVVTVNGETYEANSHHFQAITA